MMYFSRICMTPKALPWVLSASEYGLHRAVWTLFGDSQDRERDFLYRRDDKGSMPRFLCLSQRPPQSADGFSVETKPFEPKLKAGQVLEFSVRVNPVRTEWVDGKQKRRDVVMDHKKKLEAQGVPTEKRPSGAAMAQEAGVAWFLARAGKWGLEADEGSLMAGGYHVLDFTKDGRGERRRVRLATLDISGVVEVRDPALLAEALRKGIGPAKGFGCGLMLLKPQRG